MRLRALPSMCLATVPPAALLLVIATGGVSLAATGLVDYSDTGATVRCLPVQYREGAAAYRECVIAGDEDSASSSLDALSFDDRYALERACTDAADPGDCVDTELGALRGAPTPFLGALDADDRNAVLRQCFAAQGRDGVAAWRRCLDDALAAVEGLPAPEPDALPLSERGALALRCAADEGTAADYRRCRLEALGVPLDEVTEAPLVDTPADAIEPDGAGTGESVATDDGSVGSEVSAIGTDEGDTDADGADTGNAVDTPRNVAGTNTRRVTLPADPAFDDDDPAVDGPAIDDLAAGEPVVTARDVPVTGAAEPLEDPADMPPPDLRQRVDDARGRLVTTISGLDGTERIVMFAALALPLLLLGLWAVGRGARARDITGIEPDRPPRNTALVDRVAPLMQRTDESEFHDGFDDGFDDDTSDDDFFADIDGAAGTAGAHRGAAPGERERDRAAFVALDDSGAFENDPDRDGDLGMVSGVLGEDVPPARADVAPRSAFGRWLSACEAPLRRQYAVEFLIYWMAYGDERYEPALAEALLRDGGDDGDPHDLIKRRVLEADTPAFADVVRWVQGHCGELERAQIIDLLMVLLVGDGAMTPVQNTLLHFLADAFGLGAVGLEQRHEEAFGQPMPALARVDLGVWWERIEPARLPRWDARSVAALDERDQHRVRLGLPLDGELDESRIVEAFRRAARRCQPHRFDALGERERALAERQFTKFEEARDRLLGVRA